MANILSICDEWFSNRGGISTFNRSLCQAFAAAGHDVGCLVPFALDEEMDHATKSRVRLIQCPRLPGLSTEAALCLPIVTDKRPDIVIGHGHVTGQVAAARVHSYYPGAKRIHVFHTLPDEIEWHKPDREEDPAQRVSQKQTTDAQLAMTANLAIGVGPRLTDSWNTHMSGIRGGVAVHRVIPGLPEAESVTPPPRFECLLLGRLEDRILKGVDIAAAAMSIVVRDEQFRGAQEPKLVLRGAVPGTSAELRQYVIEAATIDILCTIKEYTSHQESIREDIKRSSLLLMPSRVEGFGLVAFEAIAHGVPVLVSQRSGVGELLLEIAKTVPDLAFVKDFVVDVTGNISIDASRWAESIKRILLKREECFGDMARLRRFLIDNRYWEKAVSVILNGLTLPIRIPESPAMLPDQLQFAAGIANTSPTEAVSTLAGLVDEEMASMLASRGIAKRGLRRESNAALMRHKGYLSPDDWKMYEKLIGWRNRISHRGDNITTEEAQSLTKWVTELLARWSTLP